MFAESIVRDVGLKRSSRRNRQRGMLELRTMAAIGRMASSISPDMRHSLSIFYANIEFLQHTNLPSAQNKNFLSICMSCDIHGEVNRLTASLRSHRTGTSSLPDCALPDH
jgi:hypothetical protein